jgi:hypothetical protein
MVRRTWVARSAWAPVVSLVAAFSLAALGAWPAMGESSASPVIRIEEDWELVVTNPDPDSVSPQVTCVFSPLGDADTVYAAFDINLQGQPEFTPGGLQLQLWEGEDCFDFVSFSGTAVMRTSDESVTWTQSMSVDDGTLVIEILAGASQSWGEFGTSGELRISSTTTLENLGDYSPDVSVANSGPGFAGNRVKSLTLLRVRYHHADGSSTEDAEPRVVHSLE